MGAMTSSLSFIFAAAGMLSWVMGLGVSLIFIVVIATIVRRYRPDAVPLLLAAMVLELLIAVCGGGISMFLPSFVGASMGMKVYAQVQALNTSVVALLHAGARGLLLWGIVRLARPAHAPL